MRATVRLLLIFGLSLGLVSCRSPDGPRHPLPNQSFLATPPDGLSRVVLFNTSNRALYFESGPIRIQLNGRQLPSIWLDHYVQAFVEPGEYELKLEHYDVFFWKGTHLIQVDAPEVFLEVYNLPTTTKYRRVDQLPDDFHSRFTPGRDPGSW